MADWQVDIELLDRLPQNFEFHIPIEHRLPEAKLWSAVILDAIGCAWRGSKEDKDWLFDPFYRSPHSFDEVCGYLQLDADEMRAALFRKWDELNLFRISMSKLARD